MMLIKRVELKNFKSHVESVVKFNRGLNLILGLNGAGKTSVLQAIGFALVGMKEEGSFKNKEFMTNFNKSEVAIVKLVFIANDGMEYTVIRKIDGMKSSWDLVSEKNMRWKGKTEVLERLVHLIGIDGEAKKVYKRIITAYQNDMTSIFLEDPAKKKEFFNDLFGTKIYKDISSKEVKKYLDDLRFEKIKEETKIDSLENEIKKIPDLKVEILNVENDLKSVNEKVNSLIKRKKDKKEDLEKLKALRENHRKILADKKRLEENLEDAEKGWRDAKKRLKEAIVAKEICENTQSYYEKFRLLEEEKKKIEIKRSKLESGVKKLENLEKSLLKMKSEEDNLSSQNFLMSQSVDKGKNKIHEIEEKISLKKKELESLKTEKAKHEKEEEKISCEVENAEKMGKEVKSYSSSLKTLEIRINEISKHISETYSGEIEKLRLKISSLGEKGEKLDDLKAQRAALKGTLKNLNVSKSSLEMGICPILQEKCLNVAEKDNRKYFEEKIKDVEERISAISLNIKAYETSIDEMRKAQSELQVLLSKEKDNSKLLEELKKRKDERKEILEEFMPILNSLSNTLGNGITVESAAEEYNDFLKKLSVDLQKTCGDLKAVEDKIEDVGKEISSLLEDEKKEKVEIEKHRGDISKNNDQIIDLKTQESVTSSEIEELSKIKIEFEDLKSQFDSVSKDMTISKPYHDKYLKNINISQSVDAVQKELEEIESHGRKMREDHEKFSAEEEVLRKSYDDEMIKSVEETIQNLDVELQNGTSQRGKLEERTKNLKLEMVKLSEKKKEAKDEKKKLNILNGKLRFAKELRSLLDIMGPEMAQRYRNLISLKATQRYRNLTIKPDEIKWNEDYEVHLISSGGATRSNRRFSLLSGGEQMIVALSIRAALTETFSKTKFAIFDEPTVNLDEERRKSLSEYLPKLFENMDQVIVVTHDDTFREMAENVIVIEKENGISIVKNG